MPKNYSPLDLPEMVAPTAPLAARRLLFPKADGYWYSRDSASVDTKLARDADVVTLLTGKVDKILTSVGAGSNANTRVYRDLLNHKNPSTAQGTSVIIRTGITFGNRMLRIKVEGYSYVPNNGVLDLDVNFYAYSVGPLFVNGNWSSNGTVAVSGVTGYMDTGTSTVVLVVTLATSIEIPQVTIPWALVSQTVPPDAEMANWTIAYSTDLTGLSLSTAFARNSHQHSGADVTSGTVPAARLGSGTPGATNFLRGDGAWTVPTPSMVGLTNLFNPAGAPAGAGALLYSSSAAADAWLAAGTSGQVLKSAGAAAPTWAALTAADSGIATDAVAGVGSLRTLGAGAQQAVSGTDARLSDARTPTAHNHAASEVISGNLDVARLGTTPAATEYLKSAGVSGAAAWVTPATVKTDLALNNVDNTSDVNKPVSTAQAAADATKATDTAVVHLTGNETVAGVKTFTSQLTTSEQATKPATPASGSGGFYFKTDGLPYAQGDDGVERALAPTPPSRHANPGFDGTWVASGNGHGTVAPNWDDFWQAAGVTDSYDTVDFVSGGGSFKITQTNTGAQVNTRIQNSAAFGVLPGDVVTVSLWAKSNLPSPFLNISFNTGVNGAAAAPFGGGTVQGSNFSITTAWTLYTAQFTIPTGELFARIGFIGQAIGAGSFWLDESASSVVTPAPAVLPANAWPKEVCRVADTGSGSPNGGAFNVVDGVTLAVGDRVLKAIAGGHTLNGIYTVTTVGTGTNGVWARAGDASASAQLAGAEVAIRLGTANGGTRWSTNWRSTDTLDGVGATMMSWWTIGADTGWINVTFATVNWQNYAGFAPCQYRKIDKLVRLRGLIQRGTGGNSLADETMFTLPVGYRPVGGDLIMLGDSSSGGDTGVRVNVKGTGTVSQQAILNLGGYCSMSAIAFLID